MICFVQRRLSEASQARKGTELSLPVRQQQDPSPGPRRRGRCRRKMEACVLRQRRCSKTLTHTSFCRDETGPKLNPAEFCNILATPLVETTSRSFLHFALPLLESRPLAGEKRRQLLLLRIVLNAPRCPLLPRQPFKVLRLVARDDLDLEKRDRVRRAKRRREGLVPRRERHGVQTRVRRSRARPRRDWRTRLRRRFERPLRRPFSFAPRARRPLLELVWRQEWLELDATPPRICVPAGLDEPHVRVLGPPEREQHFGQENAVGDDADVLGRVGGGGGEDVGGDEMAESKIGSSSDGVQGLGFGGQLERAVVLPREVVRVERAGVPGLAGGGMDQVRTM